MLIMPAWIMKYYILDLSPHNSLVRYLTEQGFTVFMISWRNPSAEDRDLGHGGLSQARRDGRARRDFQPHARVKRYMRPAIALAGRCSRSPRPPWRATDDDRLQTMTLLAAQTDFTEAGELTLFIDESQVTFLEDIMWEHGYLDTKQMAGAFQLLRSNDLIWSVCVHTYLMGERQPMTDLMAWNADATRMPYRMHSEYLRRLFLNNDLAEGRLRADGGAVALNDIRAPIFAVGTEKRSCRALASVYKIHLLTDTRNHLPADERRA